MKSELDGAHLDFDDDMSYGDYLALEFAGVPLLIVRDKDDVVRAFANSCRHRGSALLDEGTGNCRSLICPYHSWTYNLDGTLAGAPEMHKTEDFDRSKNGLIPIRLETWGGFMFVCFDQTAPPLSTWLGGLPEKLACYRPEDMVLTRRRVYDMDCNWKLFVENAKESYHIATVHKATINKYASVRAAGYWVEEPTGEYVVTFAQHENSMALLAGDAGFPTIESLAGRREANGTYAPLLYPSTYLAYTIDCAWYLELHPLGPNRTRLVHGALFPKSRTERADFEHPLGRGQSDGNPAHATEHAHHLGIRNGMWRGHVHRAIQLRTFKNPFHSSRAC